MKINDWSFEVTSFNQSERIISEDRKHSGNNLLVENKMERFNIVYFLPNQRQHSDLFLSAARTKCMSAMAPSAIFTIP